MTHQFRLQPCDRKTSAETSLVIQWEPRSQRMRLPPCVSTPAAVRTLPPKKRAAASRSAARREVATRRSSSAVTSHAALMSSSLEADTRDRGRWEAPRCCCRVIAAAGAGYNPPLPSPPLTPHRCPADHCHDRRTAERLAEIGVSSCVALAGAAASFEWPADERCDLFTDPTMEMGWWFAAFW